MTEADEINHKEIISMLEGIYTLLQEIRDVLKDKPVVTMDFGRDG